MNIFLKLITLLLLIPLYSLSMQAPRPAPAPGDKRTADQAFESFEEFLLSETQLFDEEKIVPYDINQLDDLEMLQSPPANTLPEFQNFIPEEIQTKNANQELDLESLLNSDIQFINEETIEKTEEVDSKKRKRKAPEDSLIESKKTGVVTCKECQITKNTAATMIYHLKQQHKQLSRPWKDHYTYDKTVKVACDVPGCNAKILNLDLHKKQVHAPEHADKYAKVACDFPECEAIIARYMLALHKNWAHGSTDQLVKCDFPQCPVMVKAEGLHRHKDRVHGPGAQLVECNVCGAEIKKYLFAEHKKLHTS